MIVNRHPDDQLIECLFIFFCRSEWMDNAKDFCYNLALTSSTDEKSEDEDEAFVDDIRWDFFWRIEYF